MPAIIEDTYAEAFRSIYVEFLITARDRHVGRARGERGHRQRFEHDPVRLRSGRRSLCGPGCDESYRHARRPAGRDRPIARAAVSQGSGRAAWSIPPSFAISQNVLTCPTARCFNLIKSDPKLSNWVASSPTSATGFEKPIERFGRKMWWIPTLGGEFILDRRLGYADGLMGGNLWYLGESEDAALDAAMAGVAAIQKCPGVIMPFPGGIAGSGSKAGSKYPFLIASTYEKYCPALDG